MQDLVYRLLAKGSAGLVQQTVCSKTAHHGGGGAGLKKIIEYPAQYAGFDFIDDQLSVKYVIAQ